jgi:hypothetical protein
MENNTMETKRRRSKRVPFRTPVHFAAPLNKSHKHSSFITDLSYDGVCMKTNKFFTPGRKLCLFIDVFDKNYVAEGIVSWTKNVSPKLAWIVKNRLGIKLRHIDHRLIDLYEQKIKNILVKQGYLEIY